MARGTALCVFSFNTSLFQGFSIVFLVVVVVTMTICKPSSCAGLHCLAQAGHFSRKTVCSFICCVIHAMADELLRLVETHACLGEGAPAVVGEAEEEPDFRDIIPLFQQSFKDSHRRGGGLV